MPRPEVRRNVWVCVWMGGGGVNPTRPPPSYSSSSPRLPPRLSPPLSPEKLKLPASKFGQSALIGRCAHSGLFPRAPPFPARLGLQLSSSCCTHTHKHTHRSECFGTGFFLNIYFLFWRTKKRTGMEILENWIRATSRSAEQLRSSCNTFWAPQTRGRARRLRTAFPEPGLEDTRLERTRTGLTTWRDTYNRNASPVKKNSAGRRSER